MDQYNLTIGKLSDQTGVKIETIRYYEKIGLMPAPPRTQSGRRLYDGALADRLCFIRRGRELGFSLDDIRALLGMNDSPPSCAEVNALTTDHLARVKEKISALKKLERTLTKISKDCALNDKLDCPIIDALSQD